MHKADLILSEVAKNSIYDKESGLCKICHKPCSRDFFNIISHKKMRPGDVPELGHLYIAHNHCADSLSVVVEKEVNFKLILPLLLFFVGIGIVVYSFVPFALGGSMDFKLFIIGLLVSLISRFLFFSCHTVQQKTAMERHVDLRFARMQKQRKHLSMTSGVLAAAIGFVVVLFLFFIILFIIMKFNI
jgi:hypothetical protein